MSEIFLKESPIRTKYKPEVEKELQHIEDKDEQDIARNLMKIAKRFASAQSEATRGFSRFCRSSHVKLSGKDYPYMSG